MNEDVSAPRRLSRAEAKQQTRERLIAATATVVARRGFAGASVDEIAETAGYTVGALYSQFGNKNALVVEAMHVHIAERVDRARAIMEAGSVDSPDDRSAMGELLADSADGDDGELGLLFWAELWLHAARNPDLAALLAAQSRAVDEVIASSIRGRRAAADAAAATDAEAPRRPEALDVSDETLATVVSSLFRGLAQRRRIDPTAVPDDLLGQALLLVVAGRRALRSTPAEGERS